MNAFELAASLDRTHSVIACNQIEAGAWESIKEGFKNFTTSPTYRNGSAAATNAAPISHSGKTEPKPNHEAGWSTKQDNNKQAAPEKPRAEKEAAQNTATEAPKKKKIKFGKALKKHIGKTSALVGGSALAGAVANKAMSRRNDNRQYASESNEMINYLVACEQYNSIYAGFVGDMANSAKNMITRKPTLSTTRKIYRRGEQHGYEQGLKEGQRKRVSKKTAGAIGIGGAAAGAGGMYLANND